jgi:rhodanese-related sulfurtransferase
LFRSTSPPAPGRAGDALFLILLSVALGLLHHAARSDRPLFVPPPNPAYGRLPVLSAAQLRQVMEKPGVVLVDARPEASFRAGTIPGSRSLPLHAGLDQSALEPLRKARLVVVFCSNVHCNASKQLAVKLQARGISGPRVYPGGFVEWKRLGYPVTSGS